MSSTTLSEYLPELLLKNYLEEDALDFKELYETFLALGDKVAPYLADTSLIINQMYKKGKNILTWLDIKVIFPPYVPLIPEISETKNINADPNKIDVKYKFILLRLRSSQETKYKNEKSLFFSNSNLFG